MPITVTCECGKQLRVKDESAGKKGRCPTCGATFTIPAAASARPSSPAAGPAPQPRPSARTTSTSGRKPTIDVGVAQCPGCGAPLGSAAVLCVRCGFDTRSGSTLQTAVGIEARTARTRTPLPRRQGADGAASDGGPRAYRNWGWLYLVLVPAGAIGATVGCSRAGLITFDWTAFESSWMMMKIAWAFFGGALAGAVLVRLLARILPK